MKMNAQRLLRRGWVIGAVLRVAALAVVALAVA